MRRGGVWCNLVWCEVLWGDVVLWGGAVLWGGVVLWGSVNGCVVMWCHDVWYWHGRRRNRSLSRDNEGQCAMEI